MTVGRREPAAPATLDISCGRAEHVDALLFREIPERGRRRKRRAIIEHKGSPGAEARNEPVPHHPAASGEKEEPLAWPQIAVQPMLLEMLQQRAARAMHDAFRHARGTGRKQDVDGMIERQPFECERLGCEWLEEIVKRNRARHVRGGYGGVT